MVEIKCPVHTNIKKKLINIYIILHGYGYMNKKCFTIEILYSFKLGQDIIISFMKEKIFYCVEFVV